MGNLEDLTTTTAIKLNSELSGKTAKLKDRNDTFTITSVSPFKEPSHPLYIKFYLKKPNGDTTDFSQEEFERLFDIL